MPRSTNEGFKKAGSDNLPALDALMMAKFFLSPTFLAPEIRHVKTQRSIRFAYSDNAVGFVQVKRENSLCQVLASVTAEHKVRTNYIVHVVIDEKARKVLKARCNSCPARNDGCKHAVAFVAWLHRRSEEPPPTSVVCYWRRSPLSRIGTDVKFLRVESLAEPRKASFVEGSQDNFVNAFISVFSERPEFSLVMQQYEVKTSNAIHHLMMQFKKTDGDHSGENFLLFCSSVMSEENLKAIAQDTEGQSESSLWFDMRCSRITASKIYEVSRCKTPSGSLVNSVLGVVKIKDTEAMARGRLLEKAVIAVVQKSLSQKIKHTGFVIKKEQPVFGASPDGITKDYVIEVKCPSSEETFQKYFENDTTPAKRYKGQVLLQMLLCDRKKGLFCVAHPDFCTSKKVKVITVVPDELFLSNMMKQSLEFWIENIFTSLYEDV